MTDPTATLRSFYQAAIDRVDPYRMIHSLVGLEEEILTVKDGGRVHRFALSDYRRIAVVGAGKASAPMAQALEELLGNRITESLVTVKYGHTGGLGSLDRVRLREAGHPVPDEAGQAAATELAALARGWDAQTLVLNVLSGGGSALLPAPVEGLTLADKQEVTRLLLASGADIQRVNGVRKHLSALKGGRLAALAAPATLVNLVLSDVVGDPLDAIASGPTVADPSTWEDAWATLEAYRVTDRLPPAARRIFLDGRAGRLADTPKPGDPVFARVTNVLAGTNHAALEAAADAARAAGYRPLVLTSALTGEARELALVFAGIARDQLRYRTQGEGPLLVLAGGESTVTLRGPGKGGRNQEMALAFLAELERWAPPETPMTFLSAATDGNDGPTDAAGAFASPALAAEARRRGLDPTLSLAANDSYGFFDAAGGLFRTGPTNTNVCDLQFLLVGP